MTTNLKKELAKYKATFVIPAYNEEAAIGDVIKSLKEELPDSFEIIVINDASIDKTGEIARSNNVRVITHKVNRGYGASIKTGMRNANNETIILFDADGQHDIKFLPNLLEAFENSDMAVGHRQNIPSETLWRVPGKWVIHKLANFLSAKKIPDLNCGFRIFNRTLLLRYEHLLSNRFSFSTTSTLVLLGEEKEISYVPIRVHSRIGHSNVNIRTGFQTILTVIRMIVQFNPLRVFLPLTFSTGFLTGLFFIYDIFTVSISNTTVVLFLATIMLFSFGILADQIANIRKELNRTNN